MKSHILLFIAACGLLSCVTPDAADQPGRAPAVDELAETLESSADTLAGDHHGFAGDTDKDDPMQVEGPPPASIDELQARFSELSQLEATSTLGDTLDGWIARGNGTIYFRGRDECVALEVDVSSGTMVASVPLCRTAEDARFSASTGITLDSSMSGGSLSYVYEFEDGCGAGGLWSGGMLGGGVLFAATDDVLAYGGTCLTFDAHCQASVSLQQTCLGGGTRTCSFCDAIDIDSYECNPNVGIGFGTVVRTVVATQPADCSKPCPGGYREGDIERIDDALDATDWIVPPEPGDVTYRFFRSLDQCQAAAAPDEVLLDLPLECGRWYLEARENHDDDHAPFADGE